MKDDATPRDFLRRFGPLREAVSPLADLARLQPEMLTEIIELAMVMGVHAQERKAAEPDLTAIASTLKFWRNPNDTHS